jgi:hypothetical protein
LWGLFLIPTAKQRGGGDCLLKTQDFAKFLSCIKSDTCPVLARPSACRPQKEEPTRVFFLRLARSKALVNGGRNPDGPKVAKFLGS